MKKILITSSFVLPSVAFAQSDLVLFLFSFKNLLSLLVPAIFGLVIVYFFWGTANFVLNAGNEKTRQDGKNKMIWGIIIIFVFVALLGILSLIGDLLGIETPTITGTTPPPLQSTPFPITPYP